MGGPGAIVSRPGPPSSLRHIEPPVRYRRLPADTPDEDATAIDLAGPRGI